MENKIKVILTTISNLEEAKSLSRKMVENDLSPCIQLIPQITSIYKWKEKIYDESETLVLIKVLKNNELKVKQFIEENHSYKIPEIISINANILNENYSKWFFSKKH